MRKLKKMKNKSNEYVYFLYSDYGIKIGKSKNPDKRTSLIATQMPFKIVKIEIYQVNNMDVSEKHLHNYFQDYRLNGEWFKIDNKQIEKGIEILKEKYQPTSNHPIIKKKNRFINFRIDNLVYNKIINHREGRYSHMSVSAFIIHMTLRKIEEDKKK